MPSELCRYVSPNGYLESPFANNVVSSISPEPSLGADLAQTADPRQRSCTQNLSGHN